MKEFELIKSLFAPLATAEGSLGLTDDAALLDVPLGKRLVVTKDLMISGVHFRTDDPARAIGSKLLRVNLSDLAAMGADPVGYFLGLALPSDIDEDWISELAKGLESDQERYGISLYGGDTTAGSRDAVLSVTAFGLVDRDRALRRSTARAGDLVFVTGTIGDGALGLAVLNDEIQFNDDLVGRYRYPEPRIEPGRRLGGYASACIDVSDGLVADLGHICDESGVAVEIHLDRIPLSEAARSVVETRPDILHRVLTGGDDYELVFTAPPDQKSRVAQLCDSAGVLLTEIGTVKKGEGVRVLDHSGKEIRVVQAGYEHFER